MPDRPARGYALLVKSIATSLLLPMFGMIADASTILHTLDPQAYRDEAALYPIGPATSNSKYGCVGMAVRRNPQSIGRF